MNGRMENDIKRNNKIKELLKELPEYISEWNSIMIATNNTSSSRLDYIRKIYKFLRFIDNDVMKIKPDQFTKSKVDAYLSEIIYIKDLNGNIKETSDSYKGAIWCCLNNFFDFLVEYGYVKDNPINMKKKPKNKDLDKINSKRIMLTEDDFRNILMSVENGVGTQKAKTRQEKWQIRDKCIMLVFMTTGIRETALTEIDVSDLNFETQELIVLDKGDKTHVYYFEDEIIDCIKEWIKLRNIYFPNITNNALFVNYQGERISSKGVVKLVDKYCKDALGYHISPHKIRAGFCSIMYNQTKDIEKVRRMIGHSNITTTQRYIVTNNDERRESSKMMSNLIFS